MKDLFKLITLAFTSVIFTACQTAPNTILWMGGDKDRRHVSTSRVTWPTRVNAIHYSTTLWGNPKEAQSSSSFQETCKQPDGWKHVVYGDLEGFYTVRAIKKNDRIVAARIPATQTEIDEHLRGER